MLLIIASKYFFFTCLEARVRKQTFFRKLALHCKFGSKHVKDFSHKTFISNINKRHMEDACYLENARVLKYDKLDIFLIFNIHVCIIFSRYVLKMH